MTDILDKIDASLEEVEEQLLAEFKRVRNSEANSETAVVDTGIKNALLEVATLLHGELNNTGDRANLQLMTERHEVLFARVAVLRQVLKAEIPTALVIDAHEGVKVRRQRLEERVLARREKDDAEAARENEEQRSGLLGSLRGLFDHKPSEQQLARNKIKVTRNEEDALAKAAVFLDNGIYSASRELAMLASLLRGGTLDRPPEAQMAKGKAVFQSRELSGTVPPVNKIAPVKPEPRPDVRDTRDARERKEPEEASEKRDIAQTPEAIRRKLEARRNQAAVGKATFAAKDIEPVSPPEFRRKPESLKEPLAPPPPPTGKAIFAAKDIEPEFPQEAPRKRVQREEPLPEKEQPRSGPAIFESRDLSKSPFPKK